MTCEKHEAELAEALRQREMLADALEVLVVTMADPRIDIQAASGAAAHAIALAEANAKSALRAVGRKP